MSISEETLAEWSALCDKATRAPWEIEAEEYLPRDAERIEYPTAIYTGENGNILIFDLDPLVSKQAMDDAAFVCAARTAVPALIAEVWRLRRRLDAVLDIRYNEP